MDIESWYGRSKRLTLGAHTLCVVDFGASDVPTLLIHGFPHCIDRLAADGAGAAGGGPAPDRT